MPCCDDPCSDSIDGIGRNASSRANLMHASATERPVVDVRAPAKNPSSEFRSSAVTKSACTVAGPGGPTPASCSPRRRRDEG